MGGSELVGRILGSLEPSTLARGDSEALRLSGDEVRVGSKPGVGGVRRLDILVLFCRLRQSFFSNCSCFFVYFFRFSSCFFSVHIFLLFYCHLFLFLFFLCFHVYGCFFCFLGFSFFCFLFVRSFFCTFLLFLFFLFFDSFLHIVFRLLKKIVSFSCVVGVPHPFTWCAIIVFLPFIFGIFCGSFTIFVPQMSPSLHCASVSTFMSPFSFSRRLLFSAFSSRVHIWLPISSTFP